MLERQPADVQRLLLRTSLLDRVNGELADLLTGTPGSERTLLALEDANAFVVSLDPGRTWFRYHRLFGDLLRLELRRTAPEDVPELHRLAARWSADHAQTADAVHHLQSALDWADAVSLLSEHALSLTLDGQAGTVAALLRAFPAGIGDRELAPVHAIADLNQLRLDEADAEAGRSSADVALASDLRAVALLNLGVTEAWSMRLADSERHLLEGTALAHLTLVEAHLLEALACRELTDERAARDALEQALKLAEPDRLILPFAMTGAWTLLETCHCRGPHTPHWSLTSWTPCLTVPWRTRRRRFPPRNSARASCASCATCRPTSPAPKSPASCRSLNTVNTHIRKIYAKLGATGRSSAVQRGRELRLLSSGRT